MQDLPTGSRPTAGPATSFEAASQGIATYFYRVKAHNGWGDSGWSATLTATVRWEAEPNNEAVNGTRTGDADDRAGILRRAE